MTENITNTNDQAVTVITLTEEETARKIALENIITKGLKNVFVTGIALKDYSDAKLYRAEYDSMEAWAKGALDMAKGTLFGYLNAAKVYTILKDGGIKANALPTNEGQCRPLYKFLVPGNYPDKDALNLPPLILDTWVASRKEYDLACAKAKKAGKPAPKFTASLVAETRVKLHPTALEIQEKAKGKTPAPASTPASVNSASQSKTNLPNEPEVTTTEHAEEHAVPIAGLKTLLDTARANLVESQEEIAALKSALTVKTRETRDYNELAMNPAYHVIIKLGMQALIARATAMKNAKTLEKVSAILNDLTPMLPSTNVDIKTFLKNITN